jgi:hypothetical protein
MLVVTSDNELIYRINQLNFQSFIRNELFLNNVQNALGPQRFDNII